MAEKDLYEVSQARNHDMLEKHCADDENPYAQHQFSRISQRIQLLL